MQSKLVTTLQFISIGLIWLFVLSLDSWIISLLFVAKKLNDAINASVGIGIVAIPLFLTIASVLTYVFIGLRRNAEEIPAAQSEVNISKN